VTLLDLKEGQTAEVRAVRGGREVLRRLNAFGLHAGRIIRMVKAAPFRGPLLVEDVESGGRTMLGRGLAGKVEVRHGPERAR